MPHEHFLNMLPKVLPSFEIKCVYYFQINAFSKTTVARTQEQFEKAPQMRRSEPSLYEKELFHTLVVLLERGFGFLAYSDLLINA